MFRFNCYSSAHSDTFQACQDIGTQLVDSPQPSFMVIYFDVQLITSDLWQWFSNRFQQTPFILSSSCQGSFCHNNHSDNPFATLTVITIEDPDGLYQIERSLPEEISDAATAKKATERLLVDINNDPPELLWVTLTPGNEEEVISGIQQVMGQRIPIVGGSASDNDVSGQWQIYTHHDSKPTLMAIASLIPSVAISFSFSSGYAPSGLSATVTQSAGRTINTLDNAVAADLYNTLTHGIITEQLTGGSILAQTSFHPIGREVSKDEYLLSHPEAVNADGTINLFSKLDEGDLIHIMHGSSDSLLDRAHQVIQNARYGLNDSQVAGCLLIYCAGCMLSVKPQFKQVIDHIKYSFSDVPVAGAYTFGEQGCFLDGQSRHGNLMISAVVFGAGDNND